MVTYFSVFYDAFFNNKGSASCMLCIDNLDKIKRFVPSLLFHICLFARTKNVVIDRTCPSFCYTLNLTLQSLQLLLNKQQKVNIALTTLKGREQLCSRSFWVRLEHTGCEMHYSGKSRKFTFCVSEDQAA